MQSTGIFKERGRAAAWLNWVVLAGIGLWFSIDLLRTLAFAVAAWGLWSGITEGMAALRLGEILILIPLGIFLLVSRRSGSFLSRARWVMWAGALLAGGAYLGLNGRIEWAPLALVIAMLGLTTPLLAGIQRGCAARPVPWMALVGLLLLHLLVHAAGFIFHGYAVVPYPAPYPRPAAGLAERQQQDVHYLGNELARLHMNAYHSMPPEAYWAAVARLESAAPSLSPEELALEMMRFVAAVGDAHTSYRVGGQNPLRALPVDFAWYGFELYVRGISEKVPQAVGARVVQIGSMPVEDVYQAVLPYISHENDAWARTKSGQYLNLVQLLVMVGAVEKMGPVKLTLETANRETIVVEVAPLEPGEKVEYLSARQVQPYYLSRPELDFWYEYRASSRTLYFRYANCTDPLGFRKAAGEFWAVVQDQPVDRLIIDLRGNGGGNTFQFDTFFGPRLQEHPEFNDPERLFILIDRYTFSAASYHAAELRVNTRATLVGEPTGGKPNGYGEMRSFTLPNARGRVYYSTNYFHLMTYDPLTIEPDLLIYAPAQAHFSGRDPLLETLVPGEDW